MHQYNILSVDWDYFINATIHYRASHFPDGGSESLPEFMQNTIWMGRYTHPSLLNVGILKDEISELIDIIKEGSKLNPLFMIADSHAHIYEFLKKHASKNSSVYLANIDFHHDHYMENKREVNCGNWLPHIMKYFHKDSSYEWIARKDSDTMKMPNVKTIYENFESLKNIQWDFIYICRSGMWSPPHLDEKFKESFEWITKDKYTVLQKGIFDTRYTKKFEIATEEYRDAISKFL